MAIFKVCVVGSLLLTLGPGVGVLTILTISHPEHDCTISY